MSSGTPKVQTSNINDKTPSQKSIEDKEKEKSDKKNYLNKKNIMPNFIERSDLNEKNFPQKSNYFNEKMNSIKSPIIDYFSPAIYFQKYHSPEDTIHFNKNLYNKNQNNNVYRSVEQNFIKSPEQNFNFSPSNIFNKDSNNLVQNNSSTNSLNIVKIPTDKSKEEEDDKTLQERIGILLGKMKPIIYYIQIKIII